MQRALQNRRQRIRRVRALRSGNAGKTMAGGVTILLLLGLVAMSVFAGLVFSVYQGYADDLPPDPRVAFAKQVLGPARIYDRNGVQLYEFEDENDGLRNPVPLRDISEWVKKATVATEDANFYDNRGINVRGLARAGIENLTDEGNGLLQGSGGSSITQQLVKNVFIPEDQRYTRSPDRKLKEAVLALELTERYSKDQILEWYLNQIHYGNRTNGIEAAARRYFGKSARDLTLGESALLAGIPNAPGRFDPYRNTDATIARQHEVLDLMVRAGFITEGQAVEAKAEQPTFRRANVDLKAPHWVFYVRDLLIAQFGEETFRSGGLRVTTTLDLAMNDRAEQIVKDKISFYESPQGGSCQCHNGALVTIDNRTGEILAMVGSRDYWRLDIEGENNNALAIKQPGSALKPFVYLAAFMKGWNPGTILYDQPTKFLARVEAGRKEYFTPIGPNRVWHGGQSARSSLGNSMNTAAVKAAGFVGTTNVIDLVHAMGIKSMDDPENYGVSIATGGSNLTLLDLTYAYSVLANNGEMRGAPAIGPKYGVPPNPQYRKLDPVAILEVTDANGRVLYKFNREQPGREQVVPAGFAYQVNDILKDNNAKRLTYGANPEAQFDMPDRRAIAAKTGTQQGPKEIGTVLSTWNFGYNPDLTVGVWVGNQDNKLVNPNLTSASSSLLIWKEFMAEAFKMMNLPPRDFPVPTDIKWVLINGKREPLVDGQKVILAEDLRLWASDGNPTVPTNGGALISPEPRALTNCRAFRQRTATGQELPTLDCNLGGGIVVPVGGTPVPPDTDAPNPPTVPRIGITPVPQPPVPTRAPVTGTQPPTVAPLPPPAARPAVVTPAPVVIAPAPVVVTPAPVPVVTPAPVFEPPVRPVFEPPRPVPVQPPTP